MKTITKDKIRFGFDASFEPVLMVDSGETVCFETQDCYAEQIDYDKKDFSLLDMKRNNPVTGPLYVNEAEPGDTQSPGPHGGNLDIKELGIGSTICLPVSVPGALLAIGDCHAVQGDGETAICGMEMSAKVIMEFPKKYFQTHADY